MALEGEDQDLGVLLKHAELAPAELNKLQQEISLGDTSSLPAELLSDAAPENKDIRTQIMDMTIPQRIKAALFGGAVCRQILIFDPNKMVQLFVLRNPKMTQAEVDDIAKNKSVSDHVLRAISDNRTWTKNYATKLNLASNPKTPVDLSLKWIKYLRSQDLKKISKSKDLPQAVTNAARRRLNEIESE